MGQKEAPKCNAKEKKYGAKRLHTQSASCGSSLTATMERQNGKRCTKLLTFPHSDNDRPVVRMILLESHTSNVDSYYTSSNRIEYAGSRICSSSICHKHRHCLRLNLPHRQCRQSTLHSYFVHWHVLLRTYANMETIVAAALCPGRCPNGGTRECTETSKSR